MSLQRILPALSGFSCQTRICRASLPRLAWFDCCSLSSTQKLAVLKDAFQLDSGSQQELWGSSPSLANSDLSIPRLYSDAGSQTDIPAEVRPPSAAEGRQQRFNVLLVFSS